MNASSKTIVLALISLVFLFGLNTFSQYIKAQSTQPALHRSAVLASSKSMEAPEVAPIQTSLTEDSREAFSKLSQIKENRISKVDINQASMETLQTLPGVGESTAKKILTLRQEQGSFQYIEDLLNVSGIGEKKLRQMEPYIDLPRRPEIKSEDKSSQDVSAQAASGKRCGKCGHSQEVVKGKYDYAKPHCTRCLNYLGT